MSDRLLPELGEEHQELLQILADSQGYVACDGKNRPLAHDLEKHRYADWKGESFGSSFWAITPEGREALP